MPGLGRLDLVTFRRIAAKRFSCVILHRWIASMGPDFVYVSGRKRPPGEMNGKSGNLNNCLQQLYPDEYDIPLNEVACVFDADQTALKEFFVKTLPLFDAGDDVGMVLSPQVILHCCHFN